MSPPKRTLALVRTSSGLFAPSLLENHAAGEDVPTSARLYVPFPVIVLPRLISTQLPSGAGPPWAIRVDPIGGAVPHVIVPSLQLLSPTGKRFPVFAPSFTT